MRLSQIKPILKRLKKELADQFDISQVYIFGSVAKNSAKDFSDIDVAIVSDQFGRDYWEERKKVSDIAARVDDRIEVHLFSCEDFSNQYDTLVSEIKKYGVSA